MMGMLGLQSGSIRRLRQEIDGARMGSTIHQGMPAENRAMAEALVPLGLQQAAIAAVQDGHGQEAVDVLSQALTQKPTPDPFDWATLIGGALDAIAASPDAYVCVYCASPGEGLACQACGRRNWISNPNPRSARIELAPRLADLWWLAAFSWLVVPIWFLVKLTRRNVVWAQQHLRPIWPHLLPLAAVLAVALLVIARILLGPLALGGGLSASSTCADFANASADEQMSVVADLYHQAHPNEPKAGPGAANAVLNVSYKCSQTPTLVLGDLSDFRSS
jgi:hypothetical protein